MSTLEFSEGVTSDRAYEYIRNRILEGKYSAGCPLRTSVLAAELNMSRTPIREALRQLEADGLVTIQAHYGARVKKMDLNEFREMCAMRLALEGCLAGYAAQQRTETDLQKIASAIEDMRRLTQAIVSTGDETDLPELIRADVRFHAAIMNAANNTFIKTEIHRLHLINRVVSGAPAKNTDAISTLGPARTAHRLEVLACHEKIYEAILAKDAVAARHAMEVHIQDVIDINLRRLAKLQREANPKEPTSEDLSYPD